MSTDSPQKSATSQQSLTEGPDFASWQPQTLIKFAHDAYAKLQWQDDQLQQMRQDLKTAMEAYRSLLRQK
jgi:hypothetical protein